MPIARPSDEIAIVCGGTGWHVGDLLRAAGHMGLPVRACPFESLVGRVGKAWGPHANEALARDATRPRARHRDSAAEAARGPRSGVWCGEWNLLHARAAIVRVVPPGSLERVVYKMDALWRVASAGVPVVNSPRAIETAVDKYLATVRLAEAGLLVPATVVCESAAAAMSAFAELGGDVVIKPLFGSQGRGLMRLTDPDLAERAFGVIERLGSVIYIQQYVPHGVSDLRALVINGRVVGAMRRWGRDWRSNMARGARAEAVQLCAEQIAVAVAAAAAVQAAVAGVDLIVGDDGRLYVPEVNAVPGWRALSAVCGVDVAAEVLSFVGSLSALRGA